MLDYLLHTPDLLGFPDGSVSKESACNAEDAGDVGLISGSGRSPEGRNGNTLQYSCLENSIDRGAWRATESPWAHKRVEHDLVTEQWHAPVIFFLL